MQDVLGWDWCGNVRNRLDLCENRMKRRRWMTPVLKWAGGKSQLLPAIQAMVPAGYGRYFEPFIGGASVLLALAPKNAVINDVNMQLINLYRQIKHSSGEIIDIINRLDAADCNKEYYYLMRDKYNLKITNNILDAECAALMIWLNKHCFNGLYRVNRKGVFNVPYNNKVRGKSIDEANIRAIGEYLNQADVSINCMDFEDACSEVKPGDFVYFDSPYVPESETADFTAYAQTGFGLSEHERLARLFKRLDKMGARLMLSNNDVDLVRSLYKDYHLTHLDVKRMINCDASRRTGKEVIVTNY